MSSRTPHLMFFVTEDWYFVSHRLPLAQHMLKAGFRVSVVTRVNKNAKEIEDAGIKLFPLKIHRSGLNLFHELATLARLVRLYARERPDIVHHVAMKPVVYGTLAAWLTGTKAIVNALAGLGFVFSSSTIKARLLRPLVRMTFKLVLSRPNARLILQNSDDARLFVEQGLVDPASIRLIRGSGVDPAHYSVTPEPANNPCLIVLPARLLRDKGIVEFVEAARLLRDRGVTARFALVGEPDPQNPTSLSMEQIQAWQKEGVVEYWGWRNDMLAVFTQANIVCLPSYREGLPKALLEAAACSRAMVATDVPGCREIVRPNETGWLVPPRDAEALANVLQEAINHPARRATYGQQARRLIEQSFSLSSVAQETLAVYSNLLNISER